MSYTEPTKESNPYVLQLERAIAGEIEIMHFSWPRALFARYNALHLHWPETLLKRRTFLGRLQSRSYLVVFLIRALLLSTPIVRTEHNVKPHEKPPIIDEFLLGILDRLTSDWITLNGLKVGRPTKNYHHIPHGHYRDWYVRSDVSKENDKLLNFGIIRGYKGLDHLINLFCEADRAQPLRLVVLGKPANAEIRQTLESRTRTTGNVATRLEHVEDSVLAREIQTAELVVLPYKAMWNSGAALLSLSLGTPILVPSGPHTDDLASEVGAQWVQRYFEPLTYADLTRSLEEVRKIPETAAPDLSRRAWDSIGDDHIHLYKNLGSERSVLTTTILKAIKADKRS